MFKDLFYDYYILETIKDDKEVEFLHHTQATMTVTQYKKKFMELSLWSKI